MKYVITIARGFGSGGKDIGMRLSRELGIPCYDRQILTMASDHSGIDESIFVIFGFLSFFLVQLFVLSLCVIS